MDDDVLLVGTLLVFIVIVVIVRVVRWASERARKATEAKHERINRQIEKEWHKAVAKHRAGTAGQVESGKTPTAPSAPESSEKKGDFS